MRSVPVLFIAHSFPPLQHSGTIRSEAFARYLPDCGVQPIVVTSTELHPSLRSSVDVRATDDWEDDPRWGGVHRLDWRYPAASGLDRTLLRLPVLAGRVRLERRLEAVDSVYDQVARIVQERRPEVIYASYNPAEAVILGSRLARDFSLPAIVDYRDLWSYQLGGPYRHKLDFLRERSYERMLLEAYRTVLVTTERAADVMREKLRVDPCRIEVLPNGYEERDFEGDDPITLGPGPFTIVHTGQLMAAPRRAGWKRVLKDWLGLDYTPMDVDYGARSPQYLLRGVEKLVDRRPSLRDTLRLWFVGVDDPEFRAATAWFKYPELLVTRPRVSSSEAVRMARGADLLLLLQNHYRLDGQDCCIAIPAKLYTYLRCRRRVLACVQPSEIADIIRDNDIGTVVDPDDVDGISEAIAAEVDRSARGEPATASVPPKVLQRYRRTEITARLAKIIVSLAGSSQASAESAA